MRALYNWLTFEHFGLFPARCVLCGDPGVAGRDLCAACERDLPWLETACERCAHPLPAPGLCGACLRQPPPFAASTAVFHYAEPVTRLIAALKFRGRLAHARLLAELAAVHFAHIPERPELLIPVPLHPSRLRQRGYNQALELARPLGHRLGIPIDYRLCQRTRATAPQSDLPAKERRRNVRGAFAVNRPLTVAHVVVFDDVVTTGHTVAELARVLRRAGAARVDVWCLARTPDPGAQTMSAAAPVSPDLR